ncbi:MAG: transcription initiation factor IIB family protein [Nitrososphaerota archaeon]
MQTQVVVKEQVDKYKCPYCGASAIQFIEKHPVCADCGLVIDQAGQVENDQPRRGRMRKRGGQHIVPNCMDIEAFIDFLGVSDSFEENMALTIASIIDVVGKMGLGSDVIEAALDIYRDIAKKCTFKGKSIKTLSAAIVYAASKRAGKACGLREIARIAGIKTNKIFRCYKFILENTGYDAQCPSIEEYIARICGRLALNAGITDIAKKIAVAAKDYLQAGAAASSSVAASIYISSIIGGERRTQREIADEVGITETTIRSRCKEIAKKLQIVITV